MKYKVWICVVSCDEEYEDVEVPLAEVATLDTEAEALGFASAVQQYGADFLLKQKYLGVTWTRKLQRCWPAGPTTPVLPVRTSTLGSVEYP